MTQTIKQFIKNNNIKMTVKKIDERKDIKWDNGNQSIAINFSQGFGIKNNPELELVLDALRTDFISDGSFQDFCDNFGYDQDSIEASKIYKACLKNTEKVKKLFNGSLNNFLNCESL